MKDRPKDVLTPQVWPKDKPLFKYLKKEYANHLLDRGELLIGTLYDFRNEEYHGDCRGDKDEGKKQIYHYLKDESDNSLNTWDKKIVEVSDTAKGNRFVDCTLYINETSEDYYIYCMSQHCNEELFADFQADVCVKIKKPYEFMRAITMALNNNINDFLRLSPCIYVNRWQKYDEYNEYHPSLIKSPDYKKQKEVRAIWTPKSNPTKYLQPILIKLQTKHVKRYCEVMTIR